MSKTETKRMTGLVLKQEQSPMNAPVIQVTDFSNVYSDSVAVDSISFEVQRSQVFGLLGPI